MCNQIKGQLNCPVCNRLLDGFTSVEDEKATPNVGDFSVCLYCSSLLQFKSDGTGGLKYEKLTMQELQLLHLENPAVFNQLAEAQDVVKQYQTLKVN